MAVAGFRIVGQGDQIYMAVAGFRIVVQGDQIYMAKAGFRLLYRVTRYSWPWLGSDCCTG